MRATYNWPTREEWAVQQRTVYYDMLEDLISTSLSNYASDDEVAAAITALRKIWCTYGHQMKEAKRNAETVVDRSYYELSEEERKLIDPIHTYQDRRREINDVIKSLRRGRYHFRISWILERDGCPPLAVIKTRYDAAWAAAEVKIENTPIDDDAWAKELQRRRDIDEYFNNPAANVHRSNV
jgi:hypothetical protein